MKTLGYFVVIVVGLIFVAPTFAAPPVVTNVTAKQRDGTKLVDITYDLADPDTETLSVTVDVSQDGGNLYDVPASTFSGDFGSAVPRGPGKKIVWNAGQDWRERFTDTAVVRITAVDEITGVPKGMVLVPAGSFEMGDNFKIIANATPPHSVNVSSFYMDKYEVSASQWNEVYDWAVNQGGYKFTRSFYSANRGSDFPVESVSWYDAVRWCNARSEKAGLTPVYYLSTAFTSNTVYRSGDIDLPETWVQWTTNGYRLPTEAEWEKAARGGLKGQHFPWLSNGDNWADFFPPGYANTSGSGDRYESGDLQTTPGGAYNGILLNPGGRDMANGFGLYDMAGNVSEWCWDGFKEDWYQSPAASAADTHGPWPPVPTVTARVLRGGDWHMNPGNDFRCAYRGWENASYPPSIRWIGFRTVRRN